MGDLKKVKATVDTWKGIKEAADHYQRTQKLGNEGEAGSPIFAPIKVRNDTGADRRQGEVVGIGDLLTDELLSNFVRFGSSAPAECQPFGVYLKATPDGDMEPVAVAGACKALVNITDTCHRFANVADGEYVLQSDDTGPVRIIYAPAGTGEKTCLVAFSWDLRGCPRCGAESGSGSGDGCDFDSFDVSPYEIPGYDATKRQALTHESGCLEWLDIEPCESGSGGV